MKLPVCFIVGYIFFLISTATAQVMVSASARATIINPISIEQAENGDLNFGNIAAGSSAGMVVLNADGSRSTAGDVTLPAMAGGVRAAEFIVTGEASYSFAVTLPTSPIVLANNTGNETMIVDNFTSSPHVTGTLANGKQILKVGATLQVSGAQAPGAYQSITPFDVIVNYN